ncbi:hypothetical protein GJ632_00405 [Halogeometricum sp. CBA1124]|nr:hypothetical protein [Halogeometricum sp. CBA1124]
MADIIHEDEEWPEVHNLRLRNWVIRKLQTVIDFERDASDSAKEIDTDLFRRVLTEGPEPSLEFLGELIELDGGYYSPGPTRAVMSSASAPVLVSGLPTRSFTGDFTIEIRGTSRHILNTSRPAIEAADIGTQSIESYVDIEDTQSFDLDWLESFFDGQFDATVQPERHWNGFDRSTSYRLQWTDEEQDVRTFGKFYALFQDFGENRGARYWLRRKPVEENPTSEFAEVPRRILKYVCLILDDLDGNTREVIFEQADEGLVVKADFQPPRPVFRWMAAIGGLYDPASGYLRWIITPDNKAATKQLFNKLPVRITDNT